MIKQGIISEELNVDSHARKRNGSCPLMPEEVLFEFSFHIFISSLFIWLKVQFL